MKFTNEFEYLLLEYISRHTETNQRKLSKALSCSLGYMNCVLTFLKEFGYIEIKPIEKRKCLYVLTPRGEKELSQKKKEYREYLQAQIKEINRKLKSLS